MASVFTSIFTRHALRANRNLCAVARSSHPVSYTMIRVRTKASLEIIPVSSKNSSFGLVLRKVVGVAGIGLGLSAFTQPHVSCDALSERTFPSDSSLPRDYPLPQSSVSLHELGFGTVTGLCAGVFVKKGAKAVAWFLGGVFVLLQYLGSASLVRVDWAKTSQRFENLFYTKDSTGTSRPPNISSLWRQLVNFLTADFQPRASFIAGFVLGLRIG